MDNNYYAHFLDKQTRERIERIVADLRRMADEIEREAGRESLDNAVSQTIHTLSWGWANLKLSILVDSLSRYHQAVSLESREETA
ncbi:hypothetical protein [Microbacterium sp. No. 7]|uniref:hypothetical protein n=1 Tax=Microbacterium sp. No. 7 TaxID=1714373 RepID=UPI0006D035B6|nr:hypothetical protein [Microbacterium sp. No. 7]ALJ19551.1 hypothetical protein AOA12_06360 [Microbacterium sp. No. 7]